MADFVLSDHAKEQMHYRGIPEDWVLESLDAPDEIVSGEDGRSVFHKLFKQGDTPYLLRIIVEKEGASSVVVTVYKTSKIEKYRSIQ